MSVKESMELATRALEGLNRQLKRPPRRAVPGGHAPAPNRLEMRVKALYEPAPMDRSPLPRRAYPGDAGFDLTTVEDVVIGPGKSKDVSFGIAVELPLGHWGLLIARSSTKRTLGLDLLTAVIDHGYRGELFGYVTNPISHGTVEIPRGTRLAQLIPLPLAPESLHPVWVDELAPSARGVAGFGSSGR